MSVCGTAGQCVVTAWSVLSAGLVHYNSARVPSIQRRQFPRRPLRSSACTALVQRCTPSQQAVQTTTISCHHSSLLSIGLPHRLSVLAENYGGHGRKKIISGPEIINFYARTGRYGPP